MGSLLTDSLSTSAPPEGHGTNGDHGLEAVGPHTNDRMQLSTGIAGLDDVLDGGLPANRHHLVCGGPGTGKTMMTLHYLSAGTAVGEAALFVSLNSTGAEIRSDAGSVGIDLSGVTVLDLSTPTGLPADEDLEGYLYRQDEDRTPIVRAILGHTRQLKPHRLGIDSLTRLRELIPDVQEFRHEVVALIRALTELGVTVLSTSEQAFSRPDDELQFLTDGVISFETADNSRTVRIAKLRGANYRGGIHTVTLSDVGMSVYPRLVPKEHGQQHTPESLSFGVPELNELLHGGLDRGTMTLISGPSGVGKTSLGAQFMKEAAGRGERSVLFLFDEGPVTLVNRCEAVSIPVRGMIQRGRLSVIPVEPLVRTPDEISHMIRTEVEDHGATVVMIDSVTAYQMSIIGSDENALPRLHALSRYLGNMGVTGLLVDDAHDITGTFSASQHGLSYLAHTVIFMRYLEVEGKLRKAIGVLKKRTGSFETTLREFEITEYGFKVGDPLSHLRGILSGMPEFVTKPGG